MQKNSWKVRFCANACCRTDLWHDTLRPSFTDDRLLFYPSGFFGGVTGVAFNLSSMVSPVLLLVMVTGALSKKMRKEILDAVKWFRLASYVVLMVMPFFLTSQD